MPLNYSSMYGYDSGLLITVKRLFGSYENALAEIGIDYETVRKDSSVASAMGLAFEKIGIEILQRCGFSIREDNYLHIGDTYIMPDAVSEDGQTFYDFKLSYRTLFQSETIYKYSPFCKKLVVIYLRGRPDNTAVPKNVRMLSIYEILDAYDLREEYQDVLQTIINKANKPIETV
ncbi:hypothetical protein [Peribacillus butanolivorans]|uniref:hypothetical protein n=1 Tax=Peribacillus butanolivorans TaxID=421767 RepID=UPI0036D99C0D